MLDVCSTRFCDAYLILLKHSVVFIVLKFFGVQSILSAVNYKYVEGYFSHWREHKQNNFFNVTVAITFIISDNKNYTLAYFTTWIPHDK